MKLREIVFVIFCATWFGCSWFQDAGTTIPDPNSDEVQKACVAACRAFVWTACGDDTRSLDEYVSPGQMVNFAETLEECSQECIRLSDHLGSPEKLECLTKARSCDDVFACLEG